MNLTQETITYILGLTTLVSLAFAIWGKVQNPQVSADQKAALLDAEVRRTSESVDRRFTDIQASNRDAWALATNHTHSVETKVDALTATVCALENTITKLATIISERVPARPYTDKVL